MIDKKLLDQLSTEDKQIFLDTLDTLINQTYVVENEYRDLKNSYEALHKILSEIIEFLPTAIWVLDEKGQVFLQNSTANSLGFDFRNFKDNCEAEIDDRSYLIKSVKLENKTIVSATDMTEIWSPCLPSPLKRTPESFSRARKTTGKFFAGTTLSWSIRLPPAEKTGNPNRTV